MTLKRKRKTSIFRFFSLKKTLERRLKLMNSTCLLILSTRRSCKMDTFNKKRLHRRKKRKQRILLSMITKMFGSMMRKLSLLRRIFTWSSKTSNALIRESINFTNQSFINQISHRFNKCQKKEQIKFQWMLSNYKR